ncbi:MAG: ABC transporter ATP-binding protein [Pseudomonadota bacterium]
MIEVTGLTRTFGETRAIEDLSFSIGSHEIVGFLGLNGAGKTTTLKILAGLLHPTAGSVRIEGQDLFGAPLEARRKIGFLPETAPLYGEMRVRDYLRFLGELRGMGGQVLDKAVEEVAERTQCREALDVVIDTLSWGYRKRVGIAQAILHAPKLVILDEPIGGLDPVQIMGMREVIAGLRDTCTVLVSSHILSEVSQTCDRLLILKKGRLVGHGRQEELARMAEHATCLRLQVRGERARFEAVVQATGVVEGLRIESENNGILTARVELTGDFREQLVAALVREGLGLRRVDDAEAELEQVFSALTSSRPHSKVQ